ncbi:hypothetical protein EFA69_08965 [Rufibacter immobilis]|uniref:Uncharacterized protein n=1 Tax=Rufibacter immobilis TaxID=1348778 RepID=A0A3M9MY40_9BACT|nr:hypothetical protein [Rufibacter immobilis]RNI29678.1 hypothetical protein EFA69_08965 [Rufibacter immobilis]
MKNTLLLIIIAFLLFLAIFFYWRNSQAESQLAAANEKITSLEQQVRRFTQPAPMDSLPPKQSEQPALQTPEKVEPVTPPESTSFEEEIGTLTEGDIQRLKRKGLKNPEADLMNDLMRKQKSLLTATGSMGGTMAIRDIRILNDRHAMAYYEDGHNGGYLLLKYAVNNGTISWTRLDSSDL